MLAGILFVPGGEIAAIDPGEARLIGVVGRPPHFAGHADAARPERRDVRGEQEGLAEGDDLRLVALLGALIVEAGEIRREEIAGDDLDAGLLEGGDLRREVVAESRELTGIDDREARLLDRGDEGVVPGIVVLRRVEERADDLVGVLVLPQADEDRREPARGPRRSGRSR